MGQEVGKGEASRDFLKLTISMFLDKSGLTSQQFFISEQRQDRLHLNTIFGNLLQCNCFKRAKSGGEAPQPRRTRPSSG